MNPSKIFGHTTTLLLTSLLAGAGLLGAADDSTTSTAPASATVNAGSSQSDEIARLKAALQEQEKQLQALQQTMKTQQELLEKAIATHDNSNSSAPSGTFNSVGQVASTTPIVPVAPLPIARPVPSIPGIAASAAPYPAPAAFPLPQGNSSSSTTGNPCESSEGSGPVPAYIRLGNVCMVPIGFMDFTPFWRDKDAGSSMGSNFGSVPLNNAATGNLSETKFTLQNSRLGLRVDGDWKGAHFIGYNEFDFNGTSGAANMAVTNGAIVPRLRLFWVDVRKNQIEFLAGQSWSMMTPNRVGLSALPGDLFYGQEIDINYLAGLTWSRQGGARIIWHPSNKVAWGFSVEQPDQYMGGSAGGSAAVLPSALTGLATTQLDNGAGLSSSPAGSYLATPSYTPDFISKIAFDPFSRLHFEVGGVFSTFKTALNQNAAGAVSISAPYNLHPTTEGGGLIAGINVGVTKNFRLISTNFWNDGEGRYMFGQAPDLVVGSNGSLHPLHSAGSIDGFEATIGKTLLYAYYGGIYIDRSVMVDANGTSLIGYGYKGSSQNRAINEVTFGFNQTMWKDPRYGAINFMGQYEWLERALWSYSSSLAGGAPTQTHDSTIYLDIRYTLPGSMPNF